MPVDDPGSPDVGRLWASGAVRDPVGDPEPSSCPRRFNERFEDSRSPGRSPRKDFPPQGNLTPANGVAKPRRPRSCPRTSATGGEPVGGRASSTGSATALESAPAAQSTQPRTARVLRQVSGPRLFVTDAIPLGTRGRSRCSARISGIYTAASRPGECFDSRGRPGGRGGDVENHCLYPRDQSSQSNETRSGCWNDSLERRHHTPASFCSGRAAPPPASRAQDREGANEPIRSLFRWSIIGALRIRCRRCPRRSRAPATARLTAR